MREVRLIYGVSTGEPTARLRIDSRIIGLMEFLQIVSGGFELVANCYLC